MLVFGMCLGVLFGLRGSMLNAARLPCERIDELNAKASDISTDPYTSPGGLHTRIPTLMG